MKWTHNPFTDALQTDFYFFRRVCFVKKKKKCTYCLFPPILLKTSHLSETGKRNVFKSIVEKRNTQFVRLAEPSVITTSTDAREWKDRSSKRQIDMSSIRHDGRVLSSRKRYIRTHARTHIRHVRIRTCVHANFAASASAHPRYSLVPTSYVVYVRLCARAVDGIHHCATNFRDKYFTDGHYAGIRVFARYKLWM